MKCLICNSDIKLGFSRCGICGFPIIHTLDKNDKGFVEPIKSEFIKKKLSGISIGLKIYNYIFKDNSLNIIGTNDILLTECNNLQLNKIVWYSESFEDLISDRKFTLNIFIKREGKDDKIFKVDMVPNRSISRSRIGVLLYEGLNLKIAVGKENNYIFSEPFSVL